jgi:hypothetical protein
LDQTSLLVASFCQLSKLERELQYSYQRVPNNIRVGPARTTLLDLNVHRVIISDASSLNFEQQSIQILTEFHANVKFMIFSKPPTAFQLNIFHPFLNVSQDYLDRMMDPAFAKKMNVQDWLIRSETNRLNKFRKTISFDLIEPAELSQKNMNLAINEIGDELLCLPRRLEADPPAASVECPICYETTKTFVMYKCHHQVCNDCFRRLKRASMKCPMCRKVSKFSKDFQLISADPSFELRPLTTKIKTLKDIVASEFYRHICLVAKPQSKPFLRKHLAKVASQAGVEVSFLSPYASRLSLPTTADLVVDFATRVNYRVKRDRMMATQTIIKEVFETDSIKLFRHDRKSLEIVKFVPLPVLLN